MANPTSATPFKVKNELLALHNGHLTKLLNEDLTGGTKLLIGKAIKLLNSHIDDYAKATSELFIKHGAIADKFGNTSLTPAQQTKEFIDEWDELKKTEVVIHPQRINLSQILTNLKTGEERELKTNVNLALIEDYFENTAT